MVDAPAITGPRSGLSRIWHIAALAKAQIKSAIMPTVGPYIITPQTNSQAMWDRVKGSLLAEYYLYHFPGWTSMHVMSYNDTYGSRNTTATNYYKAGVPRNYAYQPTRMMQVDIGIPVLTPAEGYPPMPYTAAVDATGTLNNYIVGYSTDTVLHHPVTGAIPVLPTNIFYLYKVDSAPYTKIVKDPKGNAFPAEIVLARAYTKGLVLFRTPFSTPTDYRAYSGDSNTITLKLPANYRRVRPSGALDAPSNTVALHGFEGAILVDR
jgi:hypothetical protein